MFKIEFDLVPKNGDGALIYTVRSYAFRALFMNWVESIDPKLCKSFHEKGKIRQYAVSVARNNGSVHFILTVFQDDLARKLIKNVVKEDTEAKIGKVDLISRKVSLEKVQPTVFLNNARSVQRFTIKFITPTYFNVSGGHYPMRFPLPISLFNNLANIWDSLFEEKVDRKPFMDWISQYVYASSDETKTRRADIGKNMPVAGCVGRTTYTVQKNEENFACWLEILCRLAEYTNVGSNRTAGLGVVKYLPLEYF